MICKYFNRLKESFHDICSSMSYENLEIFHIYINNTILYFKFFDPHSYIEENGEFLLINKSKKIKINCSVDLKKQQISFDLNQVSDFSSGSWKLVYKGNKDNKKIIFQASKEEIITKKNAVIGTKIDYTTAASSVSYIHTISHQLRIYVGSEKEVKNQFPQFSNNKIIKNNNLNIQLFEVEQNFLIMKIPKDSFDNKMFKIFAKKRKESSKFYLEFTTEQVEFNVIIKINLLQLFSQFHKNTRLDLFAEKQEGDFTNEQRITYYFKSSLESMNRYYPSVFNKNDFGIMPYVTKNNGASIYISEKTKLVSESFSGRVTLQKIKRSSNDSLSGIIRIHSKENYKVEYMVLKHRNSLIDDSFQVPVKRINQSNDYSFHLNLNSIDFTQFYWDFYLYIKNENDLDVHLRIKNENLGIKIALQLLEKKYTYLFPDQQYKVYPYITNSESLSLNFRSQGEYEELKYKKNERVAYALYLTLGIFFKHKNIWIIHEKYSQTAQDNSYYFFKYCYENHYDKLVYYVITKDSEDNKHLEPYQDRVVHFMSIKHLFYLLTSSKIISSEAKGHGYAWRVSHGLIRSALNKKRYVFLQHGVLGLKQIDNTFKANGVNHADLFITSSDYEKEIVSKHFGYSSAQILVSGLSRWDAPKRISDDKKMRIFFMPTWRNWLEEVSDEVFLKSNYFKEYSAFLQSKELATVLKEKDIELDFYLHPKFMPYVDLFSSIDSRINIIKFGEKTINQLVQECSLLITDYSSVAWEAYYHQKTVLFYQFDRTEYLQMQGSYMNLETDLFGECAFNSTELIEKISNFSFEMDNNHLINNNKYLKYTDQHNSKRIYEAIINNEKDITSFDNFLYRLKKNIYFRTFWKKIKKRKLILTLKLLLYNH